MWVRQTVKGHTHTNTQTLLHTLSHTHTPIQLVFLTLLSSVCHKKGCQRLWFRLVFSYCVNSLALACNPSLSLSHSLAQPPSCSHCLQQACFLSCKKRIRDKDSCGKQQAQVKKKTKKKKITHIVYVIFMNFSHLSNRRQLQHSHALISIPLPPLLTPFDPPTHLALGTTRNSIVDFVKYVNKNLICLSLIKTDKFNWTHEVPPQNDSISIENHSKNKRNKDHIDKRAKY